MSNSMIPDRPRAGQVTLPDLANKINAEHEQCVGALTHGLEHAREVGRLLAEAKERVGHGQFQGWVAEHCHFSARSARRYLRIFIRWPELEAKRPRVAVLGLNQAARLLSAPRPKYLWDIPGVESWPPPGDGVVWVGRTSCQRFFCAVAEAPGKPGHFNFFGYDFDPPNVPAAMTEPMVGVIAYLYPNALKFVAFAVEELLEEWHLSGGAFNWEVISQPDVAAETCDLCEQEAARARGEAV